VCGVFQGEETNMTPTSFIRRAARAAVATAVACGCTLAVAQAKNYRLQATFDDLSTANEWVFVEAFGNDKSYLLFNSFDGPLAAVTNRLNGWLMPQLSAVGTADLRLTYDRQAPMTASSASGRTRYYQNAASAITGTLSGAGGSQSVTSGATNTSVYRNAAGTWQTVRIESALDWFSGPLPGNDFTLWAPTGTPLTLDLKAEAANSLTPPTGALASILGLDSLQVRLTSPQTFAIHGIGLYLQRNDPTGQLDNLLIDLPSAVQFDPHSVLISFTARFGVGVDRGDYATDAAFNAAKSWVDANLRQIDYDMEANFVINGVTEVQAVPEPSAALLMLAGLAVLARGRRARNRGARARTRGATVQADLSVSAGRRAPAR
jgi:hypothetical protein